MLRSIVAFLILLIWSLFAASAALWIRKDPLPLDWKKAKARIRPDLLREWNFLGCYGMWRMGWSPLQTIAQKKERALRILTDPYEVPEKLFENEVFAQRDVALLLLLVAPGLLHSRFLGMMILALAILRYYASLDALRRKAKRKTEKVASELPEILTQLILSLRAGILPLQAWRQVAQNGEGVLYEEMRHVLLQVASGESLRGAAGSFGSTFEVPGLSDFAQLFAQSMEVGGTDLAQGLERIRTTLYEEKKRHYAVEAARASERMLFPGLLLFTGILILVLAPMLSHGV